MTGTLTQPELSGAEPAVLPPPEPVFNCPQCSHYLPPGTLACPECDFIVYSAHLKQIATAAMEQEGEQHWIEARDTWRQALAWLPEGTRQATAVVERIALLDARLRARDDWRAKWTRRLGPFAPAFFFLAKIKSFFFLLFKAKFLLSFVGFFAVYWALFGWKFGLGFTLSILVHESGHYVAARRRGLKVDLPVFIPGLGAYVKWYSQGIALEDLSSIALAGPFFGLMFTVACGGLALALHSPLFSALAHVAAWLNLINLIPILGLDGAQATYSLDRTQRILVLATALIFFGILREWSFLFVAAGMAWRCIFTRDVPDQPSTRTLVAFVLLLFALGVLMYVFPDTTRML